MTQVVSLYNASFEKIFELDWKKAVLLYINGKAISGIEYFSEEIDSFIPISTPSGIFKMPRHIILKKYVYIPRREFSPTRKNIFRRDNNCCQYCSCPLNVENATVDHVLPRSKGGKHKWDNVVACCLKCNRKKGNRTPQEANMELLTIPKPLRFCNA